MSWPDWLCASAARFAGSWRCAIVSTRRCTPACLPKASACLRSSSSEAGTKWFQLRNVSSRFWANAGARPRASEVPSPAAAPDAVRRKSRREVAPMGTLLGFVVAMRSRIGAVGPALVSPPLRGEWVSASIMGSRRLSMGAGGHGRRQPPARARTDTLFVNDRGHFGAHTQRAVLDRGTARSRRRR